MRAKRIFLPLLREAGIGLALILLALVFAAAAPRLRVGDERHHILTQISINTLNRVGMTLRDSARRHRSLVGSVLAVGHHRGRPDHHQQTLSPGVAILLSVAGSTLWAVSAACFNGVVCERWKSTPSS